MGVGFRSVGFSDSKKQLSPARPDHDHLVDYGCLKVHRLISMGVPIRRKI